MSEHDDQTISRQRELISASVRAALFVALITVGSYIVIPLPFSPVPIALQSGFVLLAGVMLAPTWAIASVGTYLLIGALGLPVFAGGTGGLGHLIGPTGGYLLGYLAAAALTSLLTGDSLWKVAVATIAGTAVIYLFGVSWLALTQGLSAGEAIALGMVPFLPGDVLKIVAVAAVARTADTIISRPVRES